jgi:hypothetical protein
MVTSVVLLDKIGCAASRSRCANDSEVKLIVVEMMGKALLMS